jgi:uncharacterized protein YqeY
MKAAMKSGEKEKLLSLRLLLSDIKNFEIDNGEQDDAGVQKIIARSIKQWKDALSDYQKGNREDLIKEAEARIALLSEFLPEQASEDEVKKVVAEVVAANPGQGVGPLIGQVMKKLGGTADGGTVARLVNEALAD